MPGEKVSVAEATKQADDGQARQRSTISFPYIDIGAAILLADALHSHVGLGEAEEDQLAAWTGQSQKSSGFREQIRAARMAGLLDGEAGKFKLTNLGRSVVDPAQVREAKARAFLNIPLFKAVFEKYRGGVLPPAAALERDMVGLGVAEKQKDRARQVLERSAETAGFFELGKNRLVMPALKAEIPAAPPPPPPSEERATEPEMKKGGNGNGGGGRRLHPFIQGLLDTIPDIPDPSQKPDWPVAERAKWLQTAANIFDLIYKGEGGIKIEAAVAQRSPRPSD